MQNIEGRVWREARAMTRREVITKAIAQQLSWVQAAEIIGVTPRQMRRIRWTVEHYGLNAVMDQRGEGRGGAFLGEETSVQDAAVGIVKCHYQVLHRQTAEPLMARGVQMNQHAGHRSPFTPTPIFAARGFSRDYPGFLQH